MKIIGMVFLLSISIMCNADDKILTEWDKIKQLGVMSVLVPLFKSTGHLPRKGFPLNYEYQLIENFAQEQGVEVNWLYVENRQSLLDMLQKGQGSLIAANLTITKDRKLNMGFTVPIRHVREQLVVGHKNDEIKQLKDLKNKKIAVRQSTSYWSTLQSIKKKIPSLKIIKVADNIETEQIVQEVIEGKYDATVVDSNLISAIMTYQQQVKVAFDLTEDRSIAWGIRKQAKQLKKELDHYLNRVKLNENVAENIKGDLDKIKKRKVLRVLTRNSAASYFIWRGELMGFEYEMAKKFARKHKLQLKIIVPPTHVDLMTWLLEGKGDMIAASMTISKEREERGIKFTRFYNRVNEVVVTKKSDDSIKTMDDLSGRTIFVRQSSSYWKTLKSLQEKGAKFQLKQTLSEEETEKTISKVANGQYDLTIADSHIADIEITWRDDVKKVLVLNDQVDHGWAVRQEDQQLLKALNQFIKKEYKGLFYNVLYKKYFTSEKQIKRHVQYRPEKTGELSPYDEIVQKYAKEYGFDWRLIISQMFQESQFNPNAKSWSGANGLMQVLKKTAKQMGFDHIVKPDDNIHAGVKYLSWLRERFPAELPVTDRIWFALASYNAGLGHVRDARKLAREKGWNDKRWFNNVERAMRLLSYKKYYTKARFGFCRGREPVNYLKKISQRYSGYKTVNEGIVFRSMPTLQY
ncbi:MAG: transporter substrate-binding domain-containing protein [Methylococcales bacterium]|jgi:membrane-bound lytic murein transglycosylase F|nr:transporter substrate-binding domain-containing protein [Methylococcales bacterium]